MRNIPDFDCEFGSAQLILQDVTRNGDAWVAVNWAVPGGLPGLLEACAGFCRMVDARRVLALAQSMGPEGHEMTARYPVALEVLELQAPKEQLPGTEAALWPLTRELGQEYLTRYNEAMSRVEGARLLEPGDLPRLLEAGNCYFVHRQGQLLGFGQVQGQELLALGACVPGAGAQVVGALGELVPGEVVTVAVSSRNHRALGLYRRLGFVTRACRETWLRVYPQSPEGV